MTVRRARWFIAPMFVCVLAGCSGDSLQSNQSQWCQTGKCGGGSVLRVSLEVEVPDLGEGGAYYWSALMRDGNLVKAGESRFLPVGSYATRYIDVELDEGELPDGTYELHTFASASLAEASAHEYWSRGQQAGPDFVAVANGVVAETCNPPAATIQIGELQRFYAYLNLEDASYVEVFETEQSGRQPVAVNWYLNDEKIDPWRPERAVFTVGGSTLPEDATTYCEIRGMHVAEPFQLYLEVVTPFSRCQSVFEIWIEGYEYLTLQYRAFIGCQILEVPIQFPEWVPFNFTRGDFDFGEGDNRGFTSAPSSQSLTSRITYSSEVYMDPDAFPHYVEVEKQFGQSYGYALSQANPIVGAPPCGATPPLCTYTLKEEEVSHPVCGPESPVVGTADNSLDAYFSVENTEFWFWLDLKGQPACLWFQEMDLWPSIDVHVVIKLRQPSPFEAAQYRIVGSHDKFPWHEVYIDDMPLGDMPWDPCLQETDIWYLADWIPLLLPHQIDDGGEWNDI